MWYADDDQSIGRDGDALVVAIKKIERLGNEIEFVALADANDSGDAQVGGRVVRPGEGVAAVTGQAVVEIVRVLVGIAGDSRVERPSAAIVDHGRNLPVVENVPEKFVPAMKRVRLGGKGRDQSLALICDAGSALGVGNVRILHRGGLPGHESVLAIVDGVSIGVGQSQIRSARDAAIDRERRSVVIARSRALEFVDRAQLRDRPSQRIDARRKRASRAIRVNCQVAKESTV